MNAFLSCRFEQICVHCAVAPGHELPQPIAPTGMAPASPTSLILNAINDALRPIGAEVTECPVTPRPVCWLQSQQPAVSLFQYLAETPQLSSQNSAVASSSHDAR